MSDTKASGDIMSADHADQRRMDTGFVQRDPDSEVIHVVAQRLEDHTALLGRLSDESLPSSIERPDSVGSWGLPKNRHPRDVQIIPKSRDFH